MRLHHIFSVLVNLMVSLHKVNKFIAKIKAHKVQSMYNNKENQGSVIHNEHGVSHVDRKFLSLSCRLNYNDSSTCQIKSVFKPSLFLSGSYVFLLLMHLYVKTGRDKPQLPNKSLASASHVYTYLHFHY